MTGWTTREAAAKGGLTQHTLRWHERIGLLDRVQRGADGRRQLSQALLEQQECLKLLDTKIEIYRGRLPAAS